MHRNLDSTSELTEFAPLSPEDKSSFGLLGLSKFFRLGKGNFMLLFLFIAICCYNLLNKF